MGSSKNLREKKGELGINVRKIAPEFRRAEEELMKIGVKKAVRREEPRLPVSVKSEMDKLRRDVSQLSKKLGHLEKTPRDISRVEGKVSAVSGSLEALEEKVSEFADSLVSVDRFDREIYGIRRISEKLEKETEKDRKTVHSSIASLESSVRSVKETVSSLEGTLKDEVASQLAAGEARANSMLSEGKEKLDSIDGINDEIKKISDKISRSDMLIQGIEKRRNDDASKAERLISSLVSDFTQKESDKSSKRLHEDLKAMLESDVDDGLKSLEKSIGEMRDKVMIDIKVLAQKEADRQRSDLLKLSKAEIDEMGRNALESIRQMFREEELRALKSLEEDAAEKTNKAIRAKLDLLREEIVNDVRVAVAKEDAVRINEISKIAKRDIEDEMDKAADKIRLSVVRDVEDHKGKLGREMLSDLSRIAEKDIMAKMELFQERWKASMLQEMGKTRDDLHSGVLDAMKKELKADRESLELAARNSFDVFRNETYSRLTQASAAMKDEWEGLKKNFEKDASATLRAFELDLQNRVAEKLDNTVDRKLKPEFLAIKDAVTAEVRQFSTDLLNSGLQKNSEKARDLVAEESKRIESRVRAEIVERAGESVSLKLAKMEKDLEKSSQSRVGDVEKRLAALESDIWKRIEQDFSEAEKSVKDYIAALKAGHAELEDKFSKVHERASRDAAMVVEKRISEVEKRTIENISSIVLDINNALEKKIDMKIRDGLPDLGEELRAALRQELSQGLDDENRRKLNEMEVQIDHLTKRGASRYEDELKDMERRIRNDLESAKKEGADIKDSLEERIEYARKEALELRDSIDARVSAVREDLEDVLGARLKEIYVDMDRKISEKMNSEKREKDRLKDILDEFDKGK